MGREGRPCWRVELWPSGMRPDASHSLPAWPTRYPRRRGPHRLQGAPLARPPPRPAPQGTPKRSMQPPHHRTDTTPLPPSPQTHRLSVHTQTVEAGEAHALGLRLSDAKAQLVRAQEDGRAAALALKEAVAARDAIQARLVRVGFGGRKGGKDALCRRAMARGVEWVWALGGKG